MAQKNPTPLQKLAMAAAGKTVLKSCPGSGKTFVIAQKMLEEINMWNKCADYFMNGIMPYYFRNLKIGIHGGLLEDFTVKYY